MQVIFGTSKKRIKIRYQLPRVHIFILNPKKKPVSIEMLQLIKLQYWGHCDPHRVSGQKTPRRFICGSSKACDV